MVERKEAIGPIRQGVRWLRDLFLPSSGLMIGENRFFMQADASGNIDPYVGRPDGSEVNLTGEVLFVRATSNLTLSTSFQSIVATGGDSTKLRILLPTIGEWLVSAVVDFAVTATDPDNLLAELYVDDSGTGETGQVVFGRTVGTITNRATVTQQWKVTTTAANTPIELKAKKVTDAGTAYAYATHTTLSAAIGAGGGSAVETTDHGTLTGKGDDDHTQYGQLADAETVPGVWDFTGGIKADTISESTGAAGVTIDSVLLKDGEVDGVVVDVHAARHETGGADEVNDVDINAGTIDGVTIGAAAAPAFGSSLLSDTDDTDDVGSTSKRWGNLHLGHSVVLDPTPDADHESSGITAVFTANENQAVGDICYIDADSEMHIADADAIATSYVVGMCADATIAADASGNYLLYGFIRDDTWTWTPGGPIFLTVTGTTTNTLSQTAPTGADDCVVIVGVATHADRMLFNPSPQAIVEHTG